MKITKQEVTKVVITVVMIIIAISLIMTLTKGAVATVNHEARLHIYYDNSWN